MAAPDFNIIFLTVEPVTIISVLTLVNPVRDAIIVYSPGAIEKA